MTTTTNNQNITANEISFGIELETHLPGDDNTTIGSYHYGTQVSWLPQGWKAERDGSINAPYGRRKCEFVSPVLTGEAGIKEAHESIRKINERGARVNGSCGVHVTISFPANNAAALARLITLFAHYETGIYATTGTKNRENGQWARSVKRHGNGKNGNRAKANAARRAASNDRYHALNLTHIAQGKNRVELRLFSGSTNADKVIAWVRLALALAEYALTTSRAVSFDDRSKDERFGGPGSRSLTQLLCRLGWLTWKAWGYNGRTYGNLTAEGLPSISESTETLRRLAEKYDAC